MNQHLEGLDRASLDKMRALLAEERQRRERSDPAGYFPWHDIQKWCLEAPAQVSGDVRIMLIAGGNRGGKTKVGMGIYAQVLRRESGLNQQFMTTDRMTGDIRRKNKRDPVTIWVVPPTLEKARQDWILPQDQMGLKFWAGDLFVKHERSPDNVIYTRPPGVKLEEVWQDGIRNKELCDKTIIKSQDQKLETFESSEVDVVFFDEEVQNEAIWNSCLMRIATTHGALIMTFTPLHGLSWSYHRYWKHLVEHEVAKRVGDRCWVHAPKKGATVLCARMGSRDNPRARDYAEEIEHDFEMTRAEKDARLYGKYGFVEGTLITALAGLDVKDPLGKHALYVVDELPGQRARDGGSRIPGRILQWFLVTDPNKSYGALLSAVDADGNVFFVRDHLEHAWPDRKHAEAFEEMEKRWASGPVARYADPGSAGAQSIVNMADLGMAFATMPKGAGSVSNSIKKLRGLAYIDPEHRHPITGKQGAPRLYFFRPGMLRYRKDAMGRMRPVCETAEQLSLARQTDNSNAPPDTPHKDVRSKLDLFDCARYTAILASELALPDEAPRTRALSREDQLPTDASLKSPNLRMDLNPLDAEFYLPTYSF